MSARRQRAVPVAIIVCATMMVSGCAAAVDTGSGGATASTSTPVPPSQDRASPTPAPPEALAFMVVGDSNSTGFNGTLERGMADRTAWASLLPASQFTLVGGWAVDGATTAAMLQGLVSPPPSDAVVVMGGTNDLGQGVAPSDILVNVEQIIERADAPCVVLSAIAPFDPLAGDAAALNMSFADLAAARGWTFVDPWSDARRADGTWVPDLRTDGVHTSPAGYALAATAIGTALAGC